MASFFRWELEENPLDPLAQLVLEAEQQAEDRRYAWDRWRVVSCEERGGHWWWLDSDENGVVLSCQHCPATADDITPYGSEVLEPWPGAPGCHLYPEWHGPVTAVLRSVTYHGYLEPDEYDCWVELKPA